MVMRKGVNERAMAARAVDPDLPSKHGYKSLAKFCSRHSVLTIGINRYVVGIMGKFIPFFLVRIQAMSVKVT